MSGKILAQFYKYHSQITIGGFTNDLGIHKISNPDKYSTTSYRDNNPVKDPKHWFMQYVSAV